MRINKEIRAEQVRVIAEDGHQVGVLPLRVAIQEAEDKGLDLVEISPKANPPVCKIIDYGKLKYRLTKKDKEGKKTQHQVKLKEIKFRPNIDGHDLHTKVSKMRGFLEKGYKVKLTCMFRGREMLHIDLGEKILAKAIKEVEDMSFVEAPSKRLGRVLTTVVAPNVKKSK